MKSDSTIPVWEEPSGSREGSGGRGAPGVLQVLKTEWWGKRLPPRGENFERQGSLGCVMYSIGEKNNIIRLTSHLVLHKTKESQSIYG